MLLQSDGTGVVRPWNCNVSCPLRIYLETIKPVDQAEIRVVKVLSTCLIREETWKAHHFYSMSAGRVWLTRTFTSPAVNNLNALYLWHFSCVKTPQSITDCWCLSITETCSLASCGSGGLVWSRGADEKQQQFTNTALLMWQNLKLALFW